jgi:tartrate dehydratase alpha subunit/fumarate hydratase class I-like protein
MAISFESLKGSSSTMLRIYVRTFKGMVLPGCQDTGTAIVMGKKGQYVWTDEKDSEALSKGVHKAYTGTNLRYI